MIDAWVPLSVRFETGDPLREDPSPALSTALRQWVAQVADTSTSMCERALLRCDLARTAEDGPDVNDVEFLAWWTPEEQLLDVVDALLDLLPTGTTRGLQRSGTQDQKPTVLDVMSQNFANMTFGMYRTPLRQMLDDGRSAYAIRSDGRGLVRRVDKTVASQVNRAIRHAQALNRGSAASHLKRAHDEAYALRPDPVRAYSEAIKAVEAAAHATLEPNNQKATLGSMLGALRSQRDRVSVVLPGPSGTEGPHVVESMIHLLWTGQSSRHGNLRVTRDETIEEAQMAAMLATLLVHWFSTGAIQRR